VQTNRFVSDIKCGLKGAVTTLSPEKRGSIHKPKKTVKSYFSFFLQQA
jgi:hypothetical protein